MIILGVDSSSRSAGAAVIKDGVLLGECFSNSGLTHSRTLLPLITDCLKASEISVKDIDYIAVSVGPGSFTGVRIGISAVKGIAFTDNIRCIPVSTLEALAVSVNHFTGIICSVLDARCNQFYSGIFKSDGKKITRVFPDEALSFEELKKKLSSFNERIILVGDGAALLYSQLEGFFDNILLSDISLRYPRASSVALCAEDKNAISPEELVPVYLRLPQAQRNLLKKEENKK